MPTPSEEKTRSLADFADFLDLLSNQGFDYVVIGGCAVGAYAHLRGESTLTSDLDLYTSPQSLEEILEWAPKHAIVVRKRPQPRSIPTAFLEWRGLEIDILTYSHGLPPAEQVIKDARTFEMTTHGNSPVPIADCFHLLQNKLAVNRPKDQPHITVLLDFIHEEVVAAFETETRPRERIAPAKELLRITDRQTLPDDLARRLLPLSRTEPDLRFLANTVSNADLAEQVLARARDVEASIDDLERIVARRQLKRAAD